jgi:periplasmic divalent cation tolerance protein
VRTLINEELIACGNFFPVRSIYSWMGKIEDDREYAVIMKTRTAKVSEVIEHIKKLHSYEVPEIISFRIEEGSKEYLDWIGDEVR